MLLLELRQSLLDRNLLIGESILFGEKRLLLFRDALKFGRKFSHRVLLLGQFSLRLLGSGLLVSSELGDLRFRGREFLFLRFKQVGNFLDALLGVGLRSRDLLGELSFEILLRALVLLRQSVRLVFGSLLNSGELFRGALDFVVEFLLEAIDLFLGFLELLLQIRDGAAGISRRLFEFLFKLLETL